MVLSGVLLLLGLQTGCGLLPTPGPQGQPTPPPSPQTLRSAQTTENKSPRQPDIRQAEFRKTVTLLPPVDAVQPNLGSVVAAELTVDAVIREVLTRNPSLAQMAAAWQAAAARYPQVTSLDDPAFGATLAPASLGSNSVEPGYRVGVSQKIPFCGKLNLRGQAARAEASAAGNEVDDMRLQLIESTRIAYYEYFLVHRARAVNEESQTLLQRARSSAENRVATGKANQQEVIQLDVEIGRQRERAVTLERVRQVATARLNTLMHLPPDQPLALPPSRLSVAAALPPVEVLRDRAVALRPDLRALAQRVEAEEAAVALARREYYPDLEVGASYDTIMGNGPARPLAPQLNVGLNIPLRLPRRDAAVAEAQAKVLQRRAELARLTDQVLFQVQEAYAQVTESEQVVRLNERTILPAAGNNVEAAASAYVAGQIPLLSYLEAQRSLVNLRDRYYQGLAEYFQRRANLERAVGEPLPQ
jgi:outer membrane protein TolC